MENITTSIITLIILAFLYFLPTIIAKGKDSNNVGIIFIVNCFPVLGWIIALIMAGMGKTKTQARLEELQLQQLEKLNK